VIAANLEGYRQLDQQTPKFERQYDRRQRDLFGPVSDVVGERIAPNTAVAGLPKGRLAEAIQVDW
jgi:hypothetical protein